MNQIVPLPPDQDRVHKAAEEALRVDPLKAERDRRVVIARFRTKLRDTLARVPFVDDAVAALMTATDATTPFRAKATLLGALAYFIAPVDALPDILAVLGFTDDATVLAIAIRTVRAHILPDHYAQAQDWLLSHRLSTTNAEEVAKGPVVEHDPTVRN